MANVRDLSDLYLWGYHRIRGQWERLQGPADTETLMALQLYFAKDTLNDHYHNVQFSGFAQDSRTVYTAFATGRKPPKAKN